MNRFLTQIVVGLVLGVAVLCGCSVQEPVTVRVLSYNIHHAAGLDGRVDLERIAEVIRRSEADVVALQEVDRGVRRSGGADQPARLAELTGLHAVFGKNIDCQGGDYGNAVLSRFAIGSWSNAHLPRFEENEQRGVLEVRVCVDGRRVVFFATHLDHQADDGERLASVGVLKKKVESLGDMPLIVAGDLNAEPDSRVLARAGESLHDSADVGDGTPLTFPADAPDRRIDYVLYTGDPAVRCVEYRVIAEAVASDHRPVLAVFEIER